MLAVTNTRQPSPSPKLGQAPYLETSKLHCTNTNTLMLHARAVAHGTRQTACGPVLQHAHNEHHCRTPSKRNTNPTPCFDQRPSPLTLFLNSMAIVQPRVECPRNSHPRYEWPREVEEAAPGRQNEEDHTKCTFHLGLLNISQPPESLKNLERGRTECRFRTQAKLGVET